MSDNTPATPPAESGTEGGATIPADDELEPVEDAPAVIVADDDSGDDPVEVDQVDDSDPVNPDATVDDAEDVEEA